MDRKLFLIMAMFVVFLSSANCRAGVAAPTNLIWGADFNYNTGNANYSSVATDDLALRPESPTATGDIGLSYDVTESGVTGIYGGGIQTDCVTGVGSWCARARWDAPGGFNQNAGFMEVYLKTTTGGIDDQPLTIFDLGGGTKLLWDWQSASGGNLLKMYVNNNLVVSQNTESWYATETDNLMNGNWHHLAISWTDATADASIKGKRIWYDGYQVGWNDGDFSAMPTPDYLGVGTIWNDGNADVQWDELHVYDSISTDDLRYTWTWMLNSHLDGDETTLPAAVPEPATMAILGLGAILIRNRKK